MYKVDILFRSGKGYDELPGLIYGNPRYVFKVWKEDTTDKRTRKSRIKGWARLRHSRYWEKGEVKLLKANGRCFAEITDETGGLQLVGSWVSWLDGTLPPRVIRPSIRNQ